MTIRKILVVDDSPTERLALNDVLTRNGYSVITAENGEQAIARSEADKPDLILMDVVMPGMNGYQATRTISRADETRDIPIIFVTAQGEEQDEVRGFELEDNSWNQILSNMQAQSWWQFNNSHSSGKTSAEFGHFFYMLAAREVQAEE